ARGPGFAGTRDEERERVADFFTRALSSGGDFPTAQLPLHPAVFRALGLMLGGGLVLYGGWRTDLRGAVLNAQQFFRNESCGQCGHARRDSRGEIDPRRTTLLEAVALRYRGAPNPVPVLCHQNHLTPAGVCRVCSVLVAKEDRKGQPRAWGVQPACCSPVPDE